jgi:peptidoglycan hydrolase-like protein with peptidoglycan-binding domain
MPKQKLKLSGGDVPPWLDVMRAITGTTETPGSADNPKIMAMADFIARKYPHQAEYASYYTGDDVAWCGLTAAFCAAVADVEPPFGATDTDRWMWAQSFGNPKNWQADEIDEPCLGCFAAMSREGGGHITLVEAWTEGGDTFTSGGSFKGRGGNQSDMINVSTQNVSQVIAWMWPKGFQRPSGGGGLKRPDLAKGDTGSDVKKVQESLLIPADGEYGPVTEAAVEAFQKAHGLKADGEVGTATWHALDALNKKMRDGDDGISDVLSAAIDNEVKNNKKVHALSWKDRGSAPDGYYSGMAKCFALAMIKHNEGDPGAKIMASKASKDTEHDALAYYSKEFAGHKMDNSKDGIATLRHLFTMMVGLGMRESSGNHWEGRDTTATNVESETCEAGLFQTSWNISSFADEIEDLMEEYKADPNGFQPTFGQDVEPSTSNLDLYGSGDGAMYQWLAKQSPAFAVLVTGIGMRKGRKHWGPIERKEVEISSEIDDMLLDVEELVNDEGPARPKPKRGRGEIA